MSDNALAITKQYPIDKYNILVPVQTVTEIADIQKPVLNVVYISTDLNDKEVYVQEEAKSPWTGRDGKTREGHPTFYALTRKGLLKLMRAAGIRIVSSKSVLPSTCQKCVEVNRNIGKPVNCGMCGNKDVKYTVVISAPQLTGQDIFYECSREIIVADEVAGMTDSQRNQFLKFRTEHCESKALNRALRAAMLIKPTYTLEELKKPFVVAYLVPNLDNPDVRAKAVDSFFSSANAVYGADNKDVQRRVVQISDEEDATHFDGANLDADESSGYTVPQDSHDPDDTPPYIQDDPDPARQADFPICAECHSVITANGNWTPERIVEYSTRKYGKPLCASCQRSANTRH
ncbi:MAG: hypothetical protein PHS57_06030 [Alphaproteobacteria bacterium]|nr:hypothetical protein [Alphaproteobacteria bacterium]